MSHWARPGAGQTEGGDVGKGPPHGCSASAADHSALAVVLAAGRGSRLGALTHERSKAVLPIAGKPVVERVLEMLAAGGAERFIVVAHPSDGELQAYLERSSWGPTTRLAYQHHRLGMARALQCAAPLIRDESVASFLLASCDSLYPPGHVARLSARHREEALDAALTLMWTSPQEATSSALVIVREGSVADIIEKPSRRQIRQEAVNSQALTAPSLYALSVGILDQLAHLAPSDRGEYELPDLLRLVLAAGGRVEGNVVEARLTLTRPRDLLAMNRHFLLTDGRTASIEMPLPEHTTVVPPIRIEVGVQLGSHLQLGPGVYLESGSTVCQGVQASRVVVLRGGRVHADRTIDEMVIGPLP